MFRLVDRCDKPLFVRQAGVSLMEMLIALAIFGTIIFPMMMVPIKALDQVQQAQQGTVVNYEYSKLFRRLEAEIGQSYRFFNYWDPALASGLTMPNPLLPGPDNDESRQLFFAYWDSKTLQVRRVGYQFRELLDPGTGLSYTPLKRWQLMRVDIPVNADMGNYEVNDPAWRPAGQLVGDAMLYITNANNNAPTFVYCQGATCNTGINPQNADGVRIQAHTAPDEAMLLHFRKGDIPLTAAYFKLAGNLIDRNRNNAETQVLPFSQAVRAWTGTTASWLSEETLTLAGPPPIDFNVPINSASDLPGAVLQINDFHYNTRTGELVAVSNSANTTVAEGGAYIFKFKPGLPDYQPYTLSLAGGDSHSDPFPVAIHATSPGWPPGAAGQQVDAISVTQDDNDNIFVLFRVGGVAPTSFWISKFSPDGAFVSTFNISSFVEIPQPNAAMGLAFNPTIPDEVLVYARIDESGTTRFRILAFPKNQNEPDPDRVVKTAESVDFNDANILPLGTLDPDKVRGLEYDAHNQRYIFAFEGAGNDVQLYSLDVDVRPAPPGGEDDGPPVSRAALATRVYKPNQAQPIDFPQGVAFDPMNNRVFVAYVDGGAPTYAAVIPDSRFNLVFASP